MRTVDAYDFYWFLSYRNMVEYKWFGGRVEVYRTPAPWMLEHMKRDHNGDAESFQRNEADLFGCARVRHSEGPRETWNRWTPRLWAAFAEHLEKEHRKGQDHLKRMIAENPDVQFEQPSELVLPRPVYWDCGANRVADEFPMEVAA